MNCGTANPAATKESPVSSDVVTKRISTRDIRQRKAGIPIVALTAYSTPMARLLDRHVDLLLVGDSLGMVVYGMETTIGVTLDMMIAHARAVVRGSGHACVIVDLPFGSYQESPEQAFRNSARVLMETGAAGVKLEGGSEMAHTIEFLVKRGIPVLGHVGLRPQSVHTMGGFRTQGKGSDEARKILADAKAVADAGAFALVLEGTVEPVARIVTAEVAVPVIGIGASPACDGQILVVEDMLGLSGETVPKFVKRYADLGDAVDNAAGRYAFDVRARTFPTTEQCTGVEKPSSDH
ncbi:MAG: 3-methyl-2-oxobutanoate hydroxymethyltransferase [Telmatospirillum sp.]|nr:3-methyl-2-oxobutanoate hydroxymethyltransferase [Telmatospirillum sp.]